MASFEAIPLRDASFDVVVFNASLHYARDLSRALAEARRVTRPNGRVVVLDSPFYRSAAHGEAMLRAKRADAQRRFGARSSSPMALAFVEYLTRERLADASRGLALGDWRRHRVRYPLGYELREIRALLRREPPPPRCHLWVSVVRGASPA